jgi:hypothetical protein
MNNPKSNNLPANKKSIMEILLMQNDDINDKIFEVICNHQQLNTTTAVSMKQYV